MSFGAKVLVTLGLAGIALLGIVTRSNGVIVYLYSGLILVGIADSWIELTHSSSPSMMA